MQQEINEDPTKIVKLYSIRDTKMLTYAPPVPAPNIAVLTRDLTEIVNNPEHKFSKHATDFELFELGTYNDTNGQITPYDKPNFILTLSELKAG